MPSQLEKITKACFIFGILTMPVIAFAQKMDKPRIDKFTNDTIFYTTTEKVAGNKGSLSSSAEDIEAYASNLHGSINLHLKVELTTFDHRHFNIAKGNSVIFKLADNTLLTIPVISDIGARREGIGPRVTGRECWTGEVAVNVIKDDIKRISSTAITAIRIQGDEENFDFDIKQKNDGVIKKMLELILNPK